MSFNTRSGRGRGLQQTQVSYHQTPPRLQPNPAAFAAQYSPMLAHQLPFSSPAAPVAAVLQATAQPSPPGVVPQPLPMQSQDLPSQPGTPQFKTLQQMKMEMGTPTASPSLGASQVAEKESGTEVKNPWKKHPTFKVNKVRKRRRLNARFRKLLFPKNAIMILNELQPGLVFDSTESTNAFSQVSFHVKIEIDGEKYTGEGSSKAAAKSAAADQAVKGIMLKKIAESAKKEQQQSSADEESMDVSGDEGSEKGSSTNGRRVYPEDEVPWGTLASFALFKLFAEWKTQGSVIPTNIPPILGKTNTKGPKAPKAPTNPVAAAAVAAGAAASATYSAPPAAVAAAAAGGAVASAAGPAAGAPAKPHVPDNAETLHPVTLVGRIFPGTAFTELERLGTPPNLTFRMGCVVQNVPYSGTGKSKKEAKKQCAIEVLKTAGIPYNPN